MWCYTMQIISDGINVCLHRVGATFTYNSEEWKQRLEHYHQEDGLMMVMNNIMFNPIF